MEDEARDNLVALLECINAVQLVAHGLEPLNLGIGNLSLGACDFQHGGVGIDRQNDALARRLLEGDCKRPRAAPDIDDPLARPRLGEAQQVASPSFLSGHEGYGGIVAVERSALAECRDEVSVCV